MGIKEIVARVFPAKQPPHPLIARNHTHFAGQGEFSGPLKDYEFVVFDTELTGFDRKRDEIVAIGGVRIKGLRILCGESFYALVRPDERFHTSSTLVHRLTPHELRQAGRIDEVLPRFIEFCGDAILVGHYVGLDLDFIGKSSRRLLGGMLSSPHLDTIRLAMVHHELFHRTGPGYIHPQGAYSLTVLSEKYGLPSFEAHNALQDSIQTAYLFIYLARKLNDLGLKTLDDFLSAGIKRTSLI